MGTVNARMRRVVVAVIVAVAAMGLWPAGQATAAELLLLEETWELTEAENGFHYFSLPANAPGDLTTPDDFYNGELYTHYEIFSYPTSEPFMLQVCVWADWDYPTHWTETCGHYVDLQGNGAEGSAHSSPQSWWNLHTSDPLDWSRPGDFWNLGIVHWRPNPNEVISDVGSGTAWAERADYLPLQFRATVVLVSAGSTFSGWDYWLNGGVTPNEPPSVALTSPEAYAVLELGSAITLTATAVDSDGDVVDVTFFEGANELGTDSTAPYSHDWTSAQEGTYALTARAEDDGGGTTVSATVIVTVVSDPVDPPDGSVSSGDASPGTTPNNGSGCSCSARAASGDALSGLVLLLLLLGVVWRVRSRNTRSQGPRGRGRRWLSWGLVVGLFVGGCSDDDNGSSNNNSDPCTHDCVAGARQCDGTRLAVCSPDGDDCLRWIESQDCADSTALCVESGGDATCVDEQSCTDTCPASGDTQCGGGWVMTCGLSTDGCLAWDSTEDCAANGASCVLASGDATCEAVITERVLFDATIDWQWPIPQDYGGYGFYWWHRNNEAQYTIANYGDMPTDDWVTPVDYEHGTVYLRFEVLSQPTSRSFRVQLGIWQDYGLQPHHRECIGPGNNVAGGAGTQFVDTVGSTFADWWNHPSAPGPCDFTRPEDFYRIGIVLWDQANSCIPMGHDWSTSGCPELQAEFFPMTAHVTAVVVAPGETFSGWAAYP